jgi:hypothetical protein
MPAKTKRAITPEVVAQAIAMREANQPWSAVIEATGFNGATLRPHMAKAGFKPAQSTVAVKLDGKSIVAARKAGMPWYAISLALDTPEAKLRSLAAEADKTAASGRVYLKAEAPAKPAPKAKKPAAKPARKPAAKK